MTELITVDELHFALRRSTSRKTIALVVDRDGQLVIVAPSQCDFATIESAVRQKKEWIYKKLLHKETKLQKAPLPKQYISGEGFYYLGKSYRMQIVEIDPKVAYQPILRFSEGYFLLSSDEQYNGRKHITHWYKTQSKSYLKEQLPELAKRIGVISPQLAVMDLGHRWGSCSGSQINFHWRVVMLPPEIIEYLIVHELVHLLEPYHSVAFWGRVERIVPSWESKKNWLAENGILYSI